MEGVSIFLYPRQKVSKESRSLLSLGSVLGFDWHSSGLITTVCGAIKAGIKGLERELGFFASGGKDEVFRKIPQEQDGDHMYHHAFFFTQRGPWCVVQLGTIEGTHHARRYHWLGEGVKGFVCEAHSAVCYDL